MKALTKCLRHAVGSAIVTSPITSFAYMRRLDEAIDVSLSETATEVGVVVATERHAVTVEDTEGKAGQAQDRPLHLRRVRWRGATPASLVRGFEHHHRQVREGRADPQALIRMHLQEAATGMIHRRPKCVMRLGYTLLSTCGARSTTGAGDASAGAGEASGGSSSSAAVASSSSRSSCSAAAGTAEAVLSQDELLVLSSKQEYRRRLKEEQRQSGLTKAAFEGLPPQEAWGGQGRSLTPASDQLTKLAQHGGLDNRS